MWLSLRESMKFPGEFRDASRPAAAVASGAQATSGPAVWGEGLHVRGRLADISMAPRLMQFLPLFQ